MLKKKVEVLRFPSTKADDFFSCYKNSKIKNYLISMYIYIYEKGKFFFDFLNEQERQGF